MTETDRTGTAASSQFQPVSPTDLNNEFGSNSQTAPVVEPLQWLTEVMAGREESLGRLLDFIQVLDDKGFLRTMGYFVNDFEDLVDAGVDKMTTPEVFKLLTSGATVKAVAQAFDVSVLPQIVKGMNAVVHGMSNPESAIQIHGMLDLLKVFKDPQIRIALSTIFGGLKSFGKFVEDTQATK